MRCFSNIHSHSLTSQSYSTTAIAAASLIVRRFTILNHCWELRRQHGDGLTLNHLLIQGESLPAAIFSHKLHQTVALSKIKKRTKEKAK
jgi:hypothetical protein